MNVSTHHENNVGFVEIENGPVNAIDLSVRKGLLDAVRWAEDLQLERVIVSGRGVNFSAGADANEFEAPPVEPHLPAVLNAIEASIVPWIAAIEGVAFGGGAEIALACRMRVMSPRARIAFPEVTLGLIPGAGGTQRLPRLVGLAKALDIISGGKALSAQAVLQLGLVHYIDEDTLHGAFMINSEELSCIVPVQELPAPERDADVCDNARKQVVIKSPGQNAPLRAIDVIEETLGLTFEQGLAIERKTFLELRSSEQAKALRHIFFAERAAKLPSDITIRGLDLHHVAVVGGGTMGSGIAYALLNAGLTVTILETDDAAIERANTNVNTIVAASLKRGLIDEVGASSRIERFSVTTEFSRIADATLAIEAVIESMEVKRTVFLELEKVLSANAVMASNTSYLDIDEIANVVSDPSRVIGLHFFAPAHIMKLLEIVRGERTSDSAIATSFALAEKLRKIPVVVGVCDGFVGNRILARYREAADTVFMDGSTPWDIDNAMVEFGYAMGPYTAQDLSGLDIAHANRRRQDATRDPARRYIPIADRMVELGKLGRKTGAGWYRYPDGTGKVDDPIVADLGIEEAHIAGIKRVDYSEDEIRERLILAMINEAADILHEGIARCAADIDLVTVFGYGFPRWRGGLIHYADTLGVENIVSKLRVLEKEDAVAWKLSPLLLRCAENGCAIRDMPNG